METQEASFFGTRVRVSVPDIEAAEFVMESCTHYERLFNRFFPGSDIWRLNHADGRWTDIDGETIALLEYSNQLHRQTGGAFNVCMGRLSVLWKKPESQEEIREAAVLARQAKVEIRNMQARVSPGVEIDLGGIAKGYICDSLVRKLHYRGVKNALLDLGGNIYALGGPWIVGLRDPNGSLDDFFCALEVENASVVTSGAYERGFFLNDVFFHHILNPVDCAPVQNELLSVTVVSPSSTLTDAWATAFSVLGMEKSYERLQEDPRLEAVFVLKSGQCFATPGLVLLVKDPNGKGDNL